MTKERTYTIKDEGRNSLVENQFNHIHEFVTFENILFIIFNTSFTNYCWMMFKN